MGLAVKQTLERDLEPIVDGHSVVVHNAVGEWVVSGTKKEGTVQLRGHDGFTARYCETASYDYDVASQEMAVHDARNERVFFEIRWSRCEPFEDRLKQLVDRMQRVVVAVAAGR